VVEDAGFLLTLAIALLVMFVALVNSDPKKEVPVPEYTHVYVLTTAEAETDAQVDSDPAFFVDFQTLVATLEASAEAGDFEKFSWPWTVYRVNVTDLKLTEHGLQANLGDHTSLVLPGGDREDAFLESLR